MGLIAGGIVMGLHWVGLLNWPERAITALLTDPARASKKIGDWWQYLFVFVLASGAAWMSLMTTRRARLGWLVAILVVELFGLAWVFSLFHRSFNLSRRFSPRSSVFLCQSDSLKWPTLLSGVVILNLSRPRKRLRYDLRPRYDALNSVLIQGPNCAK
jgi:hypothetical protein